MSDPYVRSILGEKEQILFVGRQHWSNLFQNILPEILAIILIIIGVSILAAAVPATPIWLGYLVIILPLISLVKDVLIWRYHEYIITTRRVVQVFGIINKNVTDSSLEKVNDVKMEQSFFGRLFDYGDIEILTASELGINRFAKIGNPIGFKTAMLNAKARLETSEDYRLPPTPGNIPALLVELGKLRQNNIITEEEFQRKKSDLLQRM